MNLQNNQILCVPRTLSQTVQQVISVLTFLIPAQRFYFLAQKESEATLSPGTTKFVLSSS